MGFLDSILKRKVEPPIKEQDFDSLAKDTCDENEDLRERAARKLGVLSDPRAVNVVIPLIKDKEWRVRTSAVTALAKIGTPETIQPLIAALEDADDDINEIAASALLRDGGKDAQAALQRYQRAKEQKQKFKVDSSDAAAIKQVYDIEQQADELLAANTVNEIRRLKNNPKECIVYILKSKANPSQKKAEIDSVLIDVLKSYSPRKNIHYCECGFPTSVTYKDGSYGPIHPLLNGTTVDDYTHRFHCPNCGVFVTSQQD